MSKVQVVFDAATRKLVMPDFSAMTHGCQVSAMLKHYGQGANMRGVYFGLESTIAGNAYAITRPAPGVNGGALVSPNSTTRLFTTALRWRPDDAVALRFFVETLIDNETAEVAFVAPRPPQPDGWRWSADQRGWMEPG
jgi:hypothetical protein